MIGMTKRKQYLILGALSMSVILSACKTPGLVQKTLDNSVPEAYVSSTDTTNSADIVWSEYFDDPNLVALIDSALVNNQELNITMMEINVAKAEVRTRKGEYLPFVNANAGSGVEKVGRYTSQGANDANTEVKPGTEFPDPLPDFMVSANATWEIDIWRKLRNSRDAAAARYLSSIEGKNFLVTGLVSEIAHAYYELMALDTKLQIVESTIEIQQNALQIVKMQKEAAKATELAVKKFEAEVLKNQSHLYYIKQMIVVAENRINFLVGRFPQPVTRSTQNFVTLATDTVYMGIPSQLLENRPDVRSAELQLVAADLDVKVAKANFYPSLKISAGVGFQAFNPKFLLSTPESMLYSLAGDLVAPLVNRNAIKAQYYSANAKQVQAIYNYEQSILRAYIEVANQLSNINNLKMSYDLKSQQVDALTESIDISTSLFKSARADYMEVLLTQRDALESRLELIEIKLEQMNARISMYKQLGGGW